MFDMKQKTKMASSQEPFAMDSIQYNGITESLFWWVNKWIDGFMNEWVVVWIHWSMNEWWLDGWLNEQTAWRLEGWMGCMNEWVNKWMNDWPLAGHGTSPVWPSGQWSSPSAVSAAWWGPRCPWWSAWPPDTPPLNTATAVTGQLDPQTHHHSILLLLLQVSLTPRHTTA